MTTDITPRPTKPVRVRLDVLVLERGLAATRPQAQALIMAGQIRVDGQLVDKPGTKIPATSTVERTAPLPEERYVSRGGLKLEHALDTFGIDPAGLTALDVGASTGGFTDVLLQRGAQCVFAIDVGQGQLAWRLREDQRVVVLERTNIRDLASLPDNSHGACATIDVSFISLRLVLPHVAHLLTDSAWIVALVKPQFEAGKHEADRGNGIIRDPAVHRRVLTELLAWISDRLPGFAVQGLIASPITGREGNHEYLLWLRGEGQPVTIDIEALLPTYQ
jgi:23S rRNA (cytidine1920-2'-O)/16S rRNA (cytidine1409-2'-O)-methyltransferase